MEDSKLEELLLTGVGSKSMMRKVMKEYAAAEVHRALECLSHSDVIVERAGIPDGFLWSGEHEGNEGTTVESLLEYIGFHVNVSQVTP